MITLRMYVTCTYANTRKQNIASLHKLGCLVYLQYNLAQTAVHYMQLPTSACSSFTRNLVLVHNDYQQTVTLHVMVTHRHTHRVFTKHHPAFRECTHSAKRVWSSRSLPLAFRKSVQGVQRSSLGLDATHVYMKTS